MTKLCCTAPGKQNVSRDLVQGVDNSYVLDYPSNMDIGRLMAGMAHVVAIQDCFLGGEITNLLFSYF